MIVIYRQEIIQDIHLFTSQPAAQFYNKLFFHLDVTDIPEYEHTKGRKGYSTHSMLAAFLVMKIEGFSMITDLVDYLNNNLLIASYCDFDIRRRLPSYWTFNRFLNQIDHEVLSRLMKNQVKKLVEAGIVDGSFPGLDSTPVLANTKQNNPRAMTKNRLRKENQPKSDPDCRLGAHRSSNERGKTEVEFYWGYKVHTVVDCITGLPLCERTTPADVADCSVALEMLEELNEYVPLEGCSFLADKGYDSSEIHEEVKKRYGGVSYIPLRNWKPKEGEWLSSGVPLCDAGLAMRRNGTTNNKGSIRYKYICPFSKRGECPIGHKKFRPEAKNRGCTKSRTKAGGVRHELDRSSKEFKEIYALRSECERYNSRWKATGQARMWVMSMKAVSNLNTLGHIALLSIAIAAYAEREAGRQKVLSYRSRKKLKRAG